MQDIDIALVKKRSLKGAVVLVQRAFFITGLSIVVQLLFLSVFLSQTVFGIFGLVNTFIAILNYFSDIGLAAALIQKKESLTRRDLTTTFTIQQGLVGSIVLLSLIFSKQIASFYDLHTPGIWLLRVLLLSFFMSSLKTIPSILLERKLEFNKLIIPQILEQIAYSIVTVILAWKGYGIWSFTWGVLVRSVVGLVSMYIISPWRIGFGIDWSAAKKLFRFGIPFQFSSFLGLVKDDLIFMVLGKFLSFDLLGYIYWAKRWTETPLRLVMDNAIRVTFPTFSRLQHDKAYLKSAIEKTLFGVSAGVIPIYIGIIFFIQPFITIFTKFDKWQPAVLSIYLLSLTQIIASLSTPLTNTLDAIGKVNIRMMFMIGWAVSTWILVLLFVQLMGYNGYAAALLAISLSIIAVVYVTKRFVEFSFVKSVRSSVIAGVLQALLYGILLQINSTNIIWTAIVGTAGLMVYGYVLWKREHKQIMKIYKTYRQK